VDPGTALSLAALPEVVPCRLLVAGFVGGTYQRPLLTETALHLGVVDPADSERCAGWECDDQQPRVRAPTAVTSPTSRSRS
jgi:hypothetical protein